MWLDDVKICFYLNNHKPWLELFVKFDQYNMTGFPIVAEEGGEEGGWVVPPILQFFWAPTNQNQCPHMGRPNPYLKMKPPIWKENPKLKWLIETIETPLHEMIPRKRTINNNLESS